MIPFVIMMYVNINFEFKFWLKLHSTGGMLVVNAPQLRAKAVFTRIVFLPHKTPIWSGIMRHSNPLQSAVSRGYPKAVTGKIRLDSFIGFQNEFGPNGNELWMRCSRIKPHDCYCYGFQEICMALSVLHLKWYRHTHLHRISN